MHRLYCVMMANPVLLRAQSHRDFQPGRRAQALVHLREGLPVFPTPLNEMPIIAGLARLGLGK
jgi:hypothetical protein